MRFEIESLPEAERAIEYFNALHDGFLSEVVVRSHDRFGSEGEQISEDGFDLDLLIAHYNYDLGRPPHDQFLRARFFGVRTLSVAFSGSAFERSINHVDIVAATRPTDDLRSEPCLALTIAGHRLVDHNRWVDHDDLSFTFRRGVIEEIAHLPAGPGNAEPDVPREDVTDRN